MNRVVIFSFLLLLTGLFGAAAKADAALVESFGCRGAYSNVEFSELSGDGSGLFIKIDSNGIVKLFSFEGAVFVGAIEVEHDTLTNLILVVTFKEFPESQSVFKLKCNNGVLTYDAKGWGSGRLIKLTPKQEFQLTNGVG